MERIVTAGGVAGWGGDDVVSDDGPFAAPPPLPLPPTIADDTSMLSLLAAWPLLF
jgi:hypothetical protein